MSKVAENYYNDQYDPDYDETTDEPNDPSWDEVETDHD